MNRMEQFDELVDRHHTNSYKWEDIPVADRIKEEVIPLWVADMDFKTAPIVRAAVEKRAAHGVFGYSSVPHAYYEAIQNWFRNRYNWNIQKDWIQYTTGVVPAISCVLKALTMPGDKVLVTTPVYNCFFSSIRNNGCEVLTSPLQQKHGKYVIDFDDFESKCADSKTVAFVLCNPHNPGGRVWTREELTRISEICKLHGVVVVSDEIHNELVRRGNKYIPYATVNDAALHGSVICCSPSKSFNTAGLQIANIICVDPAVRRRIDRAININEVCDVNPFAIDATIAAYTAEGAAWLDSLNHYIDENDLVLNDFFGNLNRSVSSLVTGNSEMPVFACMPLEATYLAWVNCAPLCKYLCVSVEELSTLLLQEAKVYLSSGTCYGTDGEGYLRINMACPRSVLKDALRRIADFVQKKCGATAF